ncbi:MAG: hypothetical protein QM636_00035 [Rhizobium sp.]
MLLVELSSESDEDVSAEMLDCRLSMMFMSCETSCSAEAIEDCSSVEDDEEEDDDELLPDVLLSSSDSAESPDDAERDFRL